MEQEEWPDAPGVIDTDCEWCGERRPCRNVSDPYLSEVNPEADNPDRWLCRSCYVERGNDI